MGGSTGGALGRRAPARSTFRTSNESLAYAATRMTWTGRGPVRNSRCPAQTTRKYQRPDSRPAQKTGHETWRYSATPQSAPPNRGHRNIAAATRVDRMTATASSHYWPPKVTVTTQRDHDWAVQIRSRAVPA